MEEGNNGLFREKSLNRMASPEELDNYLKVTNPGTWFILSAVVVFLAGLMIWGYFGRLESTMTGFGRMDDGRFVIYVTGDRFMKLKLGMQVKADKESGQISELSPYPVPASDILTDALIQRTGYESNTPLYPVITNLKVSEGSTFEAIITLESLKPLELIFN
ncbi:MAG TPA: hypothetical protein DCL38_02960 [Lachnospiraceae bacterium]|nr:hypothetical protein [Lachnospiraceae bacterium]